MMLKTPQQRPGWSIGKSVSVVPSLFYKPRYPFLPTEAGGSDYSPLVHLEIRRRLMRGLTSLRRTRVWHRDPKFATAPKRIAFDHITHYQMVEFELSFRENGKALSITRLPLPGNSKHLLQMLFHPLTQSLPPLPLLNNLLQLTSRLNQKLPNHLL